MSNINLIISLPSPQLSGVSSYKVSYQRIDVPNQPVISPSVNIPATSIYFPINNVPNGQYSVSLKPIYTNPNINCPATTIYTQACTGVISFSTSLSEDGSTVNVDYDAVSPYVQLNASFDNGGTYQSTVTTGTSLSIAVPSGYYGNVSITLTPVCDITSPAFAGIASAPVVINVPQVLGTVVATNSRSNIVVTGILGIPSFSLPSPPLTNLVTQTGTHSALVSGTITFVVTGGLTNDVVTLRINGTSVIEEQPVFGSGTVYSFAGVSFLATDSILIEFFNNS